MVTPMYTPEISLFVSHIAFDYRHCPFNRVSEYAVRHSLCRPK